MKTKRNPLTAEQSNELDRIYREFHAQVYNHVRRVVKNTEDTEDVLIDVFDKISKLNAKPDTRFDETKASESTWIHTVTNSVILDFFRTNHQDRYTAVSDFLDRDDEAKSYFSFNAPHNTEADRKIMDAELQSQIAKAFRTLKPKYRKVAIMFFLRELKYEEIAEILNAPMGTVKGMLSRARTILQTELQGVMSFCSVNVQNVEA